MKAWVSLGPGAPEPLQDGPDNLPGVFEEDDGDDRRHHEQAKLGATRREREVADD